jgi:hypothetical protein
VLSGARKALGGLALLLEDGAMQSERAETYAKCTTDLELAPTAAAAAGAFDTALTNGLAAIIAHEWSTQLAYDDGRIKSASALLKVVEEAEEAVADPGKPVSSSCQTPSRTSRPLPRPACLGRGLKTSHRCRRSTPSSRRPSSALSGGSYVFSVAMCAGPAFAIGNAETGSLS